MSPKLLAAALLALSFHVLSDALLPQSGPVVAGFRHAFCVWYAFFSSAASLGRLWGRLAHLPPSGLPGGLSLEVQPRLFARRNYGGGHDPANALPTHSALFLLVLPDALLLPQPGPVIAGLRYAFFFVFDMRFFSGTRRQGALGQAGALAALVSPAGLRFEFDCAPLPEELGHRPRPC